MKIEIQFEAQLRQVAEVTAALIEPADGSTVLEALRIVATNLGEGLSSKLLSSEDQLQPGILVFVNEVPVAADAVAEHVLQDGDNVLLLPPISGG